MYPEYVSLYKGKKKMDRTRFERLKTTDHNVPSEGTGTSGPCPGAEILAAYIEHTLDAEQTSAVEGHLAECEDCLEGVLVARAAMNEAEHLQLPEHELKELFELVPEERGLAAWYSKLTDKLAADFFIPAPALAVCLALVCCIGFLAGFNTVRDKETYTRKLAKAMIFIDTESDSLYSRVK